MQNNKIYFTWPYGNMMSNTHPQWSSREQSVVISCNLCRKSVRESWDPRKTLRQNLSSLGLAFDANATIPLRTKKEEEEEEQVSFLGSRVFIDRITEHFN